MDDNLKALVVEDEQEMAEQLEGILKKKFSLDVDIAFDCEMAREKMASGRYDIVTLDFLLPDGRGLDFLEELSLIEDGPRVIMVTGHGDEETAVRSFRSSASGYVVKDSHLRARLIEAVEKALMELNLQRAREELVRREKHFRTLIEKASDIITIIGPDGEILFESPSVERVLGYKPGEMMGRSVFDYVHPDDLSRIKGITGRVMTSPGAIAVAEYRLLHKDGPWRTLESLARNLLDDPVVGGVVINSRDVTSRKRDEEKLRQYQERLEQLVDKRTAELAATNIQLQQEISERRLAQAELLKRAERLADFLTVASHELRHPISVVKGYATMLEGYLDRMAPEDMSEILSALETSVDRLMGYVEELMEVSLVEQGRFTFEMKDVDVRPLVETAASDMKARGADNEISIGISGEVTVRCIDPEKFIQLLVILLDNAVKFSPPASPLRIEVEEEENVLEFSVLDRGIGIPEHARELVFDRFYQVEEVKHHSSVGLGLGLYLARQIVDAHDGRIWVEPRDGGGSAFKFTLGSCRVGGERTIGG